MNSLSMPVSVAQSDALLTWSGGHGFDSRWVWQHYYAEIDHEIFSMVILTVQLIQEGQLSDSWQRNVHVLVNFLEG